jgi:YjbE family integral membrane protein
MPMATGRGAAAREKRHADIFPRFHGAPRSGRRPMTETLTLLWEILAIVWINILLSGDNAILIALACRGLPEQQRRIGMILGALGAVGLRILFTVFAVKLLDIPLLKLGGGLFVIFLAVKLPSQHATAPHIDAKRTLFSAVRAIIVADAVMSLDNVLALAAAANGSTRLIVFGLLLSAPLIMFGARFMAALMERFPLLIWAGAVVLGWAGGELIAGDPVWTRLGLTTLPPEQVFGAIGGVLVLLAALATSRRLGAREGSSELAG